MARKYFFLCSQEKLSKFKQRPKTEREVGIFCLVFLLLLLFHAFSVIVSFGYTLLELLCTPCHIVASAFSNIKSFKTKLLFLNKSNNRTRIICDEYHQKEKKWVLSCAKVANKSHEISFKISGCVRQDTQPEVASVKQCFLTSKMNGNRFHLWRKHYLRKYSSFLYDSHKICKMNE